MTYNSVKNISFSASIAVHLILLVIFLIVKVSQDYKVKDFVELSFGNTGTFGSSGGAGTSIQDFEASSNTEEKSNVVEKEKIVKEVELPKSITESKENPVKPADKSKDLNIKTKSEPKEQKNDNNVSEGQGNKGTGKSGFGFDIDWGGRGTRKIYSYLLPEYPEGVSKEADIRLKFTILPDGTVGNIIPLIKGDNKLEVAAINSLRQWRFEPLSPAQKAIEQAAVIVFPYRLR